MADDLPAALAEHAARMPEQPWLFFTEERGWRWRSFAEVAAAVAARRAAMRGGARQAEETPHERTAEAVADDLARLAEGRTLPVEGAGGPRELGGAELLAAARALARRLPAWHERDIWVSARAWRRPAERCLLAWATVTGAAVVLEPWTESGAGTIYWSRPTVVSGSAAELTALRGELARLAGRRAERALARRLRRLRIVWVEGSVPLPAEDTAFWQRLGAPVAAFPLGAE